MLLNVTLNGVKEKIMICDIVTERKFLCKPCLPVTDKKKINSVAKDLLDTAKANGTTCVGLTANQIGINVRMFAMRIGADKRGQGGEWSILVNPEIVARGGGISTKLEQCMSLYDIDKENNTIYKQVKKRRWKYIIIAWYDEKGTKHQRKFTGLEARIVQHEFDHLAGRLIL